LLCSAYQDIATLTPQSLLFRQLPNRRIFLPSNEPRYHSYKAATTPAKTPITAPMPTAIVGAAPAVELELLLALELTAVTLALVLALELVLELVPLKIVVAGTLVVLAVMVLVETPVVLVTLPVEDTDAPEDVVVADTEAREEEKAEHNPWPTEIAEFRSLLPVQAEKRQGATAEAMAA